MKFLPLLLPAVALGAVVPRADDFNSGLGVDVVSQQVVVDPIIEPALPAAENTEQQPQTGLASTLIAPVAQTCAVCDSCITIEWTHSGCGPDTRYTGKLNFSGCKSTPISWVGTCGDSSLLQGCPTPLEGGKCNHAPSHLEIGPLAANQTVTINVHDGNIAGNAPGGQGAACSPIAGAVGGNGCNNNYPFADNTLCVREFTAGEEIPCEIVDPEPPATWVPCRGETATGFGTPMNSNVGGNWFMYCELGLPDALTGRKNCTGPIQASNDGTKIGYYLIDYDTSANTADVSYQLTQTQDVKWRLLPGAKDNFKAGAWATAPSGNFPPAGTLPASTPWTSSTARTSQTSRA